VTSRTKLTLLGVIAGVLVGLMTPPRRLADASNYVLMTDSLVRKEIYGQEIKEGYAPDIHSPNTCPKETLVKITKAEPGGIGAKGVWDPAKTGFTPGKENETMRQYLAGEFITQE